MYCQNETQYLVIGSYSELMTFPLNREAYTCRVSESSKYVTYFFHIALLAMSFTYILGCRQSIWTFQVKFHLDMRKNSDLCSILLARWPYHGIPICIHFCPQRNAKELLGRSATILIKWHSLSFDLPTPVHNKIQQEKWKRINVSLSVALCIHEINVHSFSGLFFKTTLSLVHGFKLWIYNRQPNPHLDLELD